MNRIKIIHGNILTPYRIIKDGVICIEDEKICEVSERDVNFPNATVIDARGDYVSPGFIDLHTHGSGGCDFMDGTVDAFLKSLEMHAQHGTTSLYPTTLASTLKEMLATIEIYEKSAKQNTKGASMMGLHLEGPYFSMNQRGAQDPQYIRDPDPKEYMEILNSTRNIARWSSAPELKGSQAFASALLSHGILPSIAHTDAIYEEILPAFEWGYTHVTHLYSGMSGITRKNGFRYLGVIESAFLIDEMTVEIIADGVHLPPELLQLIYKIKGPGKIALITDSMRAAGMPVDKSILGSLSNGQEVLVEDGVAKLPDRSAFAGSVATTDRLVRTMHFSAGIPLLETIQMITYTPACIMGIDKNKGSLSVNKDADMVLFDEQINVNMTIIKGNIVYKNETKCH
ncbi:MAG: N-acetylglucosamine-6-phosphate deacetylase [Massilibacteroides sp.]|nr:N-acetylglucosamine-6-phosphate deacetylase [Massilibacteroides sp.]MDD3061285.1 N-acetylglucosamine-6-phosphate deacetylase [Massilibacteroides sp.]MDD4114874.1 N-acetylglucosamine-6-phosphate deacetylase [Massilibacteroides sp.]MDD4659782.1 N-acetylglucosamine-6-phosphate deacetylase [Massilibacteroides sp.]